MLVPFAIDEYNELNHVVLNSQFVIVGRELWFSFFVFCQAFKFLEISSVKLRCTCVYGEFVITRSERSYFV